jgi:hypothetical protein
MKAEGRILYTFGPNPFLGWICPPDALAKAVRIEPPRYEGSARISLSSLDSIRCFLGELDRLSEQEQQPRHFRTSHRHADRDISVGRFGYLIKNERRHRGVFNPSIYLRRLGSFLNGPILDVKAHIARETRYWSELALNSDPYRR